jgi:hypothetical protein
MINDSVVGEDKEVSVRIQTDSGPYIMRYRNRREAESKIKEMEQRMNSKLVWKFLNPQGAVYGRIDVWEF